jgi:phage/plasmid-associated DNA primase
MKQYDDLDFGFLHYNKDFIGFNNGVFNIVSCEFLSLDLVPSDLVVSKYFDLEFTFSIDTPLFDQVLHYQFDHDVSDFIYMCLGRLFGIRDNFGFMLYLLGEPGCGKSLIIDIICQCFNNIGSIGDSFEDKFGLSFLYDKDLIVCDDLPKHISKLFPQQTFQTCITGGKVPIAVKGGQGFTIDWTAPMLWAGNWFPDYLDKGQISRRMLVANFEKIVSSPQPNLKQRILDSELPALIYKSLLFYKRFLLDHSHQDIWKVCPDYFLQQQTDLKIDRNPLFKFLVEHTQYSPGLSLSIDEIKFAFSQWMGKKVTKLDNGTFLQVNPEFSTENKTICKSCKQLHKKGCCDFYSSKNRTSKYLVSNISFI